MAKRRGGISLRIFPKLLIAIIIPTILAVGGIVFFASFQLKNVSNRLERDLTDTLIDQAREEIEQVAKVVKKEVLMFLKFHPDYTLQDLQNSSEFQAIAVQRVGQTGYTALTEIGTCIVRFHPNRKLVNKSLEEYAKKYVPKFWKIFGNSYKKGIPKADFYDWRDPDGKIRKKFLFNLPIKGTKFIISSTTYVDEFLLPVKQVKEDIEGTYRKSLIMYGAVGLGFLIILIIIIFMVTRQITRSITKLVALAEAISVGNLDVEVDIQSKDEVGELAEAIRRMQWSLKKAIERLRMRRK